MVLSEKDIRSIKTRMRVGYAMPVLLLSICLLFNVVYLSILKSGANYLLIIGIDVVAVLLSWLLFSVMNRKYLRDLRSGQKKTVMKQVTDKINETSYEAGSGLPYVPILGDLFPRLWKMKPRSTEMYYLVVEGRKYEVEKEIFDVAGIDGGVEMYYTMHSNDFLGFAIPEK